MQPARLRGIALLRIFLGLSAVLFYCGNYSQRHFLWGSVGYYDDSAFERDLDQADGQFSLYVLADSASAFEVIFHAGILVAIALTLFGGRVLAVLHAVFFLSLYARNPQLLDGGDNVTRILLLFLPLCHTRAFYSPFVSRPSPVAPSLLAALHNVAAVAIVFQICVVYTVAGLWKIVGQRWREGNALYYISRVDDFSMFSLMEWVSANPYALTALTYSAVLVQVTFAMNVLSGSAWRRRLAVLLALGMHVGIGAGMGLVGFALVMIGADAACLTDDDYKSVHAIRPRLARLANKTRHLTGRKGTLDDGAQPLPERPVPAHV